jgi:hypothetical protein
MEGFQIGQRYRFKSGVPLLAGKQFRQTGMPIDRFYAVTSNFHNKVFAATDAAVTVP